MRVLTRFFMLALLICTTRLLAFPITEYDTRMDVQKDSSVIVTESITADFTNDPHHGIYRDIPLSGTDRYGNKYRIRNEIISITDDSGAPQTYTRNFKRGMLSVRIGDADIVLSSPKTYVIKYRLWRAIHFFNDYDELYWNVIGPEWEVPIEHATCIVTIPDGAKIGDIQTTSYTGAFGMTTSEALSDIPNNKTVRFWMNRALNPGEYMTIVVGWPKGLVAQPSFSQEMKWFVMDNGYFFLPPIFLLGLWLLWLKAGRDPDTGKSEMVAFDPPDNMSPAEIGTLIDERVDMRDISATIIDLAVRGFIRIEADKVKGFFSNRTDYTLKLTRPFDEMKKDPDLSDYERLLLNGLFSGMDFCVVSTLANKFYTNIPLLQSMLYDSMMKRGYFNSRPDKVRKSYLGAGVTTIAIGIGGGIFIGTNAPLIPIGWFFAVGVCGIMLAIASCTMPKKTARGKDALLAVKGFEEYISRAERQEIEYQERQGYFEKFLPYAMALGIADKWAKAFEGLQTEPPKWYGGWDGSFHPGSFTHDLNMATSNWGSTFASQPRSSGSGGGSGFSGGCSGGGGGGGGGGAW